MRDKNKNDKRPPTLRESILGRNVIKKLPDNFFEKVLQCEVTLKKDFNIQVLQELIYYYTAAVEYYESIDNPKYKHYSHSLNLLLTQPEIVKNLSGKKNYLDLKLEVKKKLKMKDKKEAEIKVRSLLKMADCDETKVLNTKGIINQEMDNQQSVFQKRKEEKKKKFLLSTSDITDAVQTMKNKRIINTRNPNKSFDIVDKGDLGGKSDIGDKSEILSDIDKSPLVINRTKALTSFTLTQGNKTKTTQLIESNMATFINVYAQFLKSKLLQNAYRDIDKVYHDKETELLETTQIYSTQIKESEFLLTSDGDQMYKDQLGKIIYNLQEEEKEEKEKIETKYAQSLKLIKQKLSDKEIQSHGSMDFLQEQFKLDIANDLSRNLI